MLASRPVRAAESARGSCSSCPRHSPSWWATDDLDPILAGLPVQVRIEEDPKRVTTAERIARRHGLLLAEIERRGDVPLTDLTALLGEPEPAVRTWIDELVQSGSLDATVQDARVRFKSLRPFQPCGGCGGPIAAVGGQVGRCVHCGSEAYVA